MRIAPFAKPRVVVGGDGVHHINNDIIMLGQGQTAGDDFFGMVTLVGGVEVVVAGEDFLLNVGD